MIPQYDLNKIKFAVGGTTYQKAIQIYESGGVKGFQVLGDGFQAKVKGSKGNFYNVYISALHYDRGNCDCYLGQNDEYCKHLAALAIFAIKGGDSLDQEEKELVENPKASQIVGELDKADLAEMKTEITDALRYIKGYSGPSKIWFAYQSSLSEGCNRLSFVVSKLPIGKASTQILIDLFFRLNKKLSEGGVDDSDGTVGDFVYGLAETLKDYVKTKPDLLKLFKKFVEKPSDFGFEDSLVELFESQGAI